MSKNYDYIIFLRDFLKELNHEKYKFHIFENRSVKTNIYIINNQYLNDVKICYYITINNIENYFDDAMRHPYDLLHHQNNLPEINEFNDKKKQLDKSKEFIIKIKDIIGIKSREIIDEFELHNDYFLQNYEVDISENHIVNKKLEEYVNILSKEITDEINIPENNILNSISSVGYLKLCVITYNGGNKIGLQFKLNRTY